MLALGIEVSLAAAGGERMAVQDHEAPELLQAAREVDLFRGIELGAEAADLPERIGPAEDERACRPAHRAADQVPQTDRAPCQRVRRFEHDRRAAADVATGLH